jgi:hypothetical protein
LEHLQSWNDLPDPLRIFEVAHTPTLIEVSLARCAGSPSQKARVSKQNKALLLLIVRTFSLFVLRWPHLFGQPNLILKVHPSRAFKQPGLAVAEKNMPDPAPFAPSWSVAVYSCTNQSRRLNQLVSQERCRKFLFRLSSHLRWR